MLKKSDKVNEDRSMIADVLIKAQEKADHIVEEAKNRALQEKKTLEDSIEYEREKLEDIRNELQMLKDDILSKLHEYEHHLADIVDASIEAATEKEIVPLADENNEIITPIDTKDLGFIGEQCGVSGTANLGDVEKTSEETFPCRLTY